MKDGITGSQNKRRNNDFHKKMSEVSVLYFRDSNDQYRHDVCAGPVSKKHILTSSTNTVEVELVSVEQLSFLIYYEGRSNISDG